MIVIFSVIFFISVCIDPLQILTQPSQTVRAISVSDNNQILVLSGDGGNVYIYQNNASFYYLYDTLNVSQSDSFAYLTGNGKWLLVLDEIESKTFVLRLDENTGKFSLHQQIIILDDNTALYAGVISENNQLLIIGKSSGFVYGFMMNANELFQPAFTFQTVVVSISHFQLSTNTNFLIISTLGNQVFVYRRESNNYNLLQTLSLPWIAFTRSYLSPDNQFLIIAGQDIIQVRVYQYVGESYVFDEAKTLFYSSQSESRYAQLSTNKKFLAVSRSYGIEVFSSALQQSPSLFFTYGPGFSVINKISNDLRYVFNSFNTNAFGNVAIFQLCLNDTDPNCRICQINNCLVCLSENKCKTCSQTFYPANQTCASCPSNCLRCLNQLTCEECSQINGYFVNETRVCQLCSLQGCSNCLSLTTCDQNSCTSRYVFNVDANLCDLYCSEACLSCQQRLRCQQCSLNYIKYMSVCLPEDLILITSCIGCMNCVNQTQCLDCLPGYQLAGGSCFKCADNCLHCRFGICEVCFEGFQLTQLLQCVQCSSNCLKCNGSCSVCLQTYYLTSSCEKCGFHCLECQSASDCNLCDLGYTLVSTQFCVQCVQGCNSCPQANLSQCLECERGFFKNQGKCQRCSDGCLLCSSSSICNQCSFEYAFRSGQCIKKCVSNCVSQNSISVSPCSVDNCTQCSETLCFECQDGFYLQNQLCFQCPPLCESCLNGRLCVTCSIGAYMILDNNNYPIGYCQPCSDAHFCLECIFSSYNCISCEEGFELVGYKCISQERIQFRIGLDVTEDRLSLFLNAIKQQIISFLSSSFLKEHITVNKIDPVFEGSILEGILTVPLTESVEDTLTILIQELTEGKEIGGTQIISAQFRAKKNTQNTKIPIPFIAGGIVVIVLLGTIALYLICRRKPSMKESQKDEIPNQPQLKPYNTETELRDSDL